MAGSLIAKDNGGGDYELIPDDSYAARCISVIEIGTVPEEYLGEKKIQHKVWITWEVPDIMRKWNDDEDEKPAVISKEYTLSLGKKATLRADLEKWRNKNFTDEGAKEFDIAKLIGAPCYLQIGTKAGAKDPTKKRNVINGIMKLPKEIKIPEMMNAPKLFTYADFDLQVFEALPDFLKTKMKTSLEYKELMEPGSSTKPAEVVPETLGDEEEDDLPF